MSKEQQVVSELTKTYFERLAHKRFKEKRTDQSEE